MTSSSVSVVIPVFNHERYISAAIYSVLAQTYAVKEIIVIDDGSSDNSPDIVQAIAAEHEQIIFWRHPNRGAHNTINAGIHRASGDLVAILNSDDMYEYTRIKKAVAAFERDPELGLWGSKLHFINSVDDRIAYPWFDEVFAFYKACGDLGASLVNGNFFMTTSNFVVRRSLFAEIGLFSDLRYAHDVDFLLRIVANRKKMLFCPDHEVCYRLHSSNTISEGAEKVKVEWAAVVAMFISSVWNSSRDWERSAALYMDILRKHTLLELVLLYIVHFRNHGTLTLERPAYKTDAAFAAILQAVV